MELFHGGSLPLLRKYPNPKLFNAVDHVILRNGNGLKV
ncbi:unnamed protein product [Camellia sinensis]